jgi:hypothetical protein
MTHTRKVIPTIKMTGIREFIKFSVAQKNVVYILAAKYFNRLEIVVPRPQAPSATIFLSVR